MFDAIPSSGRARSDGTEGWHCVRVKSCDVPDCANALERVRLTHRDHSPSINKALELLSHFGPIQCVSQPELGRRHIVIHGPDHRGPNLSFPECVRVKLTPTEPSTSSDLSYSGTAAPISFSVDLMNCPIVELRSLRPAHCAELAACLCVNTPSADLCPVFQSTETRHVAIDDAV